jgi:death-on-curing protein
VQYLTLEEVLLLHARLIQRTGGSGGVLDMGLLESAMARPRATFEGKDLYPSVWHKAAALMHSLIMNHPFVDGNKRTALTATGLLLALNGHTLTGSNEEVLGLTRQVVRGEIDLPSIADWLKSHCQTSDTPRAESPEGASRT